MSRLNASIKSLEDRLDANIDQVTLYLDPDARTIELAGIDQPIQAYNKLWIKICGLPKRVDPSSVVSELLRIEDVMESACGAYRGSFWDGSNHVGEWATEAIELAEFKASIQSLEFGIYLDPADWYDDEIYYLFDKGLEAEEVADYYGYFDGNDLLNKEEAIAYLVEQKRLWEEKEEEEEEKSITFTAPSHWAVALINGDESVFDYGDDEQDHREYKACVRDLIKQYGNAHVVDVTELGFCHTRQDYGSLPGDYSEYTLLVYKE